MRMAIKLQGRTDGVTCNHAWAIVKRGSFPAAILYTQTSEKIESMHLLEGKKDK